MTGGVRYALDGAVAIVTLDDPPTLNALNADRAAAIRDGLERAAGEARAVLLTAAGRAFCSGTSLAGDGFGDPGAILGEHYNPLIEAMRDSPLPIVVAARGAIAGIGCSLALMGDIILVSDTAYFLQAFRGIGLVPDGGSAFLLSRAVGRTRAMEMMLLGERLPAATALAWGLVNRVVADDALDAAGLAMAEGLADGPKSLGLIRRAAWAALECGLTDQLAGEVRDQRVAAATADCAEGIAAFREKRKPVFRGT